MASIPNMVDIGYVGEKAARKINIDITNLVAVSGDGTASIIFRRPGEDDDDVYPVLVTRTDNILTWDPTLTDTAIEGIGECQVVITDTEGSVIAKSKVIKVRIHASLAEDEPETELPWVTKVLAAAATVTEAEEATVASAAAAATSEANAATSETNAAASAEAAATSEANAAEYETGAKNAKTAALSAKTSAVNAQTAAETAQGKAETAQTAAEASQSAAATSETNAAASATAAAASATSVADSAEQITQNKNDIYALQEYADGTSTAELKRRLDILYKLSEGQVYDYETDSTEAYSKTVLSGSIAGTVDSFGGKSVVWNQISYIDADIIGNVSKTKNTGSSVIAGHIYYIKGETTSTNSASNVSVFTRVNGANKQSVMSDSYCAGRIYTALYGCKFTGTSDNDGDAWFYIYALDSDAVTNGIILVDLTQMFGSGNEPTSVDDERIAFIEAYAADHPQYNAGEIISADVTNVVAKGKNLFDFTSIEGTTLSSAATVLPCDLSQFKAGTYYMQVYVEDEKIYNGAFYIKSKSNENIIGGGASTMKNGIDITREMLDKAYKFAFYDGNGTTIKHIVFSNSPITEYVPYTAPKTYTIPDAVRALPGYGWSGNTVDWANKKYIQTVESQTIDDDGNLSQTLYGSAVETDISDIMTDENYFETETGGTLTFVQTSTELPVPNTETMTVKLSEVS